jgi:hypothetical protein
MEPLRGNPLHGTPCRRPLSGNPKKGTLLVGNPGRGPPGGKAG